MRQESQAGATQREERAIAPERLGVKRETFYKTPREGKKRDPGNRAFKAQYIHRP